MISPIYYDTEILNTHESASDDNKKYRGPHNQERRRISRGPSTQGMQRRPGPSYDQSRELQVRPDLETLQLYGTDKLGFSKIQHNDTTRPPDTGREYSLDQDIISVGVEERLRWDVCENENGKQLEMDARSTRRVAQEFEVQALRLELWRRAGGHPVSGKKKTGLARVL